ncbi:MAG: cysteine synthase A [Bacteroidales bacterium]|nr:cysteine synthase A [Bacteroidales bacterium]
MENINKPLELVGKTPLISLNKISTDTNAKIMAKAEFMNNGGSVKDRIAKAMIEKAEKDGVLRSGGTIVEATSGNTGIGLAWIGKAKGYKVILTMPESMSLERRNLLKAYGATLVLTPAAEGMGGAIAKSQEIAKTTENSFMPLQFENGANPLAHYKTTGPEIWEQTGGKIDVFIAGVGTGGTISGVGKYLKEKNPNIRIIAVEPENSPVLSGGQKGPHKIQGIGAGFVPKILDTNIYDEIIKVKDEEAMQMARSVAVEEGLMIGISSGANIFASHEYAKRNGHEKLNIVTVLCDTGERYLSSELFK